MKIVIILLLFSVCFSVTVFSQTTPDESEEEPAPDEPVGRIEAAVNAFRDSHKYKIGIFRIQPRVAFHSGLDANAAFGDEDLDDGRREDDFFFTVVPGVSGGIKFGTRAFLHVVENLSFVYYLKQEERRDIFNNTFAEFVTGTNTLLLTVTGGYVRRHEPVDEELDEPVEFTTTHGHATVDYPLSSRIDLRHNIRFTRTTFERTEEIENSSLTLIDRNTISVGTGTRYRWRETRFFTGNAQYQHSEDIGTGLKLNVWNVLGGYEFQSPRFAGHFQVGYGRASHEDERKNSNFLLEGRVDTQFRNKTRVGFSLSRRYEFSVLSSDGTRLTTQGGIRFATPVHERLQLNGSYAVGKHEYDSLVSGVVVEGDTFHRADVGLNIQIVRFLTVRPGVFYLNRDTNIPELDKQIVGWSISAGVGYVIDF